MSLNRREFIKLSSLAGILGAIVPSALLKKQAEGAVEPKPVNDPPIKPKKVKRKIPPAKPATGKLVINNHVIGDPINISVSNQAEVNTVISQLTEYRPIKTPGFSHSEIDIQVIYTSQGYRILDKAFSKGALSKFVLKVDNSIFKFEGYIKSIEMLTDSCSFSTIEFKVQIHEKKTYLWRLWRLWRHNEKR